MEHADIIIVGAGAAGIGAGLELMKRGISFRILEAADRVGGRAYTDTRSLPVAWDQGCHWLHCADRNPLVEWADRTGARYVKPDEHQDVFFVWTENGFVTPDGLAEVDACIDAAFGVVAAAGRAGRDVPITDLIPDAGAWAPCVDCILGLMAGDDPQYVSAQGYSDYEETNTNWPVVSGYGDLIQRMAAGLPVELGRCVTGITQTPGLARIETTSGTIQARAAIVTVSTNVLVSGAIRFGPGPAADLLPLIAEVPCGVYEKVAFSLRKMPSELQGKRFGDLMPSGELPMHVQIVAGENPMLIAHFAGDMPRGFIARGPDALQSFATERLLRAFGPGFADNITGVASTGWTENPLILGSYSHARPGHAATRHRMIAADTGNVAFAGEAFSVKWQATAHGAYQSGRDVAARVAGHLA